MNAHDCRWAKARLPLLAGCDLAVGEARRTWAHLAHCGSCRGEYVRWLETRSAVHTLLPTAANPAFLDELALQVRAHVAALPPPRARRSAWPRAAAAAALVLFGFGLVATGLIEGSHRPGASALLGRDPVLLPATTSGPSHGASLVPLAYPQGLEAQRQLLLLFDTPDGPPLMRPTLEGKRGTRDREPR